MLRWPLISRRYADLLERQLAFWQFRAEEERARAERLADQLLMVSGREPVSEERMRAEMEYATARIATRKQQEELMAELLSDEATGSGDEMPLSEDIARETAEMLASVGK